MLNDNKNVEIKSCHQRSFPENVTIVLFKFELFSNISLHDLKHNLIKLEIGIFQQMFAFDPGRSVQ